MHLVHGTRPHDPGWFVPIACSADEGINLPGSIFDGAPTCPDCIVIAERRRKRRLTVDEIDEVLPTPNQAPKLEDEVD